MKNCHRIILLIPFLIMALVASGQGEDFYEARLHAGQEAYRQRRALEAVDQLRIAVFGFLNTPALLSESLARLALAQAAAGRPVDVEATLSRFLDVERRFASYTQVKLEPDVRAEFQSLLLHRVPQATLQSLPGLAVLVETEEQKIAKLPSRERRKALEAALRREPGNAAWPLGLARESAQRQDHKEVTQWAGKALQLAPSNAEGLALRAHASAARRECAQALADLTALPRTELDARPELHGDRFVCLVESKDWSGAEAALKFVPADLSIRSDVAQAQKRLAAQRQTQSKAIAGKAGAAAKSSTKSPSPPGNVAGAPPAKTSDTTAVVSAPEKKPAGVPAAERKPSEVSAAEKKPVGVSAAEKKPADDGSKRLSPRTSEVLAESRRLVQARKASEAAKILLDASRFEPDNRELRMGLLEAFCLSGAWNRGVEQLPLVTPFAEKEALPMFYAAVVLYQTGRTEEARVYMERVVPRVSGPLVDEYARKILGRS